MELDPRIDDAGPDEVLGNPIVYAHRLLYIKDKDGNIVPFRLNQAQRRLSLAKDRAIQAGKPRRFLILKGRQQGFTTYEQAMNFHEVAANFNRTVITLAHKAKSTERIFRISNLFYSRLEAEFKPRRLTAHNKSNLDFPDLNSFFDIGTAGSSGYGRGDTINRAHLSEMAWWTRSKNDQEDTVVGIDKACDRGEVTIESTANGIGNLFHDMWKEAKEDPSCPWTPLFFAWWEDPENRLRLTKTQARELRHNYSDEEKELVKKHSLTARQIAWRRVEKKRLKGKFLQEQPENDVSCFLVSGVHYFDLTETMALTTFCATPKYVKDNGALTVWKRPRRGHRYVVGMDTAEGTPDGDFTCAGVLDVDTCEQVAAFHARVSPETGAEKAVALAKKYNNALLGIEANNHGHSALNTAKNTLMYGHLFKHRMYDATGTKKLGWQTNDKTRPIMLSGLKKAVEGRLMKVNDEDFLSETTTFQRNGESSKYEARSGSHDDRVIMWGIAWQLRQVPSMNPKLTWI